MKYRIIKKSVGIGFGIMLIAGAGLRAFQYLMGRSLWEDECHLALNFLSYDLGRLMQPLDFIQAAPVLFIVITKILNVIFGYGELVFRALPFVFSMLSLPFFFFVARNLTGSRTAALLAFAFFCCNISLIYFSSEFKAYAIDVSVFVVNIFLAISKSYRVASHRRLWLAIAGCLSILLSNVAFVGLFAVAVYRLWSDRKALTVKRELFMYASWLIVFCINYLIFIHDHPSAGIQRENYAFAFPPHTTAGEVVAWLGRTTEDTFYNLLRVEKGFGGRYVFTFLIVLGIALSFRRRHRRISILCGIPVVLHLAMSALHVYPFWYRLILYLVPCFIVFASLGALFVTKMLAEYVHSAAAVIAYFFIGFLFCSSSLKAFPMWPREIKPALDFVNGYPGLRRYLFDPVNAYRYYHARGYLKEPVYLEIPWEITPAEFYDFTGDEKGDFILFYGTVWQFGYGDVIEDLRNKKYIKQQFESTGYGVAVVSVPRPDTGVVTLGPASFPPGNVYAPDNLIVIWSGQAVSKPLQLSRGKYSMSVSSKGTPFNGVWPRNSLHVNDQPVAEFTASQYFSTETYTFELASDTAVSFRFSLLNDTSDAGADRNTFIRRISIARQR